MHRDFGPEKYDHSHVGGNVKTAPRYLPEREAPPSWDESDVIPRNRRERRLAERALGRNFLSHGSDLPIDPYRYEIAAAVRHNQVVKISGSTGCGKSTIAPLILLDSGRDSVMMQPRRLAAELVADRIADIVAKKRDGNSNGLVGCLTADTNTYTPNTRAGVVTSGVLLLQLEELLEREVTPTIIFDEAHEWSVDQEIALALVKRAMRDDPNLRIVIMSATPDNQVIDDFFSDVVSGEVASIHIEGQVYPVEDLSAPESTITEQAFIHGQDGKNILCFVRGKQQIDDVISDTKRIFRKNGGTMPAILPLHAKSSPTARNAALAEYPNGKIIVSTNVAETSVTIPGIDVVIDGGLKNEPHIDEELSASVDPQLASQDEMRQRRGRCGRLKQGLYIVTRESEDEEFVAADSSMRLEHARPEIQRMRADKVVLYVASLGLDIDELEFPHPIKPELISEAKRSLRILGALDEGDEITQLGRRMEAMHVSPELARMVVESDRYSATTRAQMVAIAASVDAGGLQYFAHNTGKRWKELVNQDESDMIAQLEIFIATMDMDRRGQSRYDLDVRNIDRAQRQYRKIMKKIGVDPKEIALPTPQETDNLKRCIYAGMIDYAYGYSGSKTYVRANGRYTTPREISDRSVTVGNAPMVVGYPYRYEYYEKGEPKTKHIIEKVTHVSAPAILGEIAMHLCVWKTTGHSLRGGSLVERQTQFLNDMDLGVTREVAAEATEDGIDFMVRHMMDNPGSALRELYAIESTLKTLCKLSPHAPKSIHQEIITMITDAVVASDLNEEYADHILRTKIFEQGISLESYISAEEMARIYESSPRSIESYGRQFMLTYERGVPLVKRVSLNEIAQLPGEVVLPDGRTVKFVGDQGKQYTVAELKEASLNE